MKSEFRAEHAVDQTISGAVDDQQEMAEVSDHQSPQGERLLPGLSALERLLNDHHLVEAEKDPGKVGDEKDENDPHEDDGQVVLLSASAAVVLNHAAVGLRHSQPADARWGLPSLTRTLATPKSAKNSASTSSLNIN